MLLAIVFAMISRAFFSRPFAFVTDYSSYALVYLAFLGAPWVMQLRRHVGVDILPQALPPHVRRWWNVSLDLLVMFVAAVIFYISANLTIDFYVNRIIAGDFLRTPRWITLVPIPVGCFFFAVQALRNAIDGICGQVKGGVGK
jgi:TRAP-type C4-dicarboxylate transport system permease small subunit